MNIPADHASAPSRAACGARAPRRRASIAPIPRAFAAGAGTLATLGGSPTPDPAPARAPEPAAASAQSQGPATPARGAQLLTDSSARTILSQLVGFWRVVGQSRDANGDPDSDLSGSAVYAWSLGGMFLAGEQILTNGSDMLQWVDFLGFNSVTQSFSRTLLSDRDPANFCSMGLWDERSRLLTFITDPVRGPDGSDRRIRSTLDLANQEQPSWELVYLVGSGAEERPIGSVILRLIRANPPQSAPGPSSPLIPSVPGRVARTAPGGSSQPFGPGPLSPAQVQQRLDSVLQQRQQMQQQIDDMRRQMRDMSGTIRRITQP